MGTRLLFLTEVLLAVSALATVGWSAGQSQTEHKRTGEPSLESRCPPLDVNAEMGRGHLGPHDPATKRGPCDEDEHRASDSGHGQNDPLAGHRSSGQQSSGSAKSPGSDFGGQGATDQGTR
jgi:hypothetical protein